MAKKREPDPNRLVRMEAGRYRTEDGRFEASSDSAGSWYLTDSEQTDELGLPRLSGPFRTMAQVREAVVAARASAKPALRVVPGRGARRPAKADRRTRPAKMRVVSARDRDAASEPAPEPREEPQPDPEWLTRLDAGEQKRARALIEALAATSVRDPSSVVRTEIETRQPEVARALLARNVWLLAIEPWARDDDASRHGLEDRDGRRAFAEAREALARLRASGADPADLRAALRLVAFATASRTLEVASKRHRTSESADIPSWTLREDAPGEPGRAIELSAEELLRFAPDE